MEEIVAGNETKAPQNSSGSRHSPISPPPFVLRGHTPWSIQANHSETRCSQLPSLSASDYVPNCNKGFTAAWTKEKMVPYNNDPCRVISAPASYAYSYHEGNFTNGRGCTWTPYYFRFLESSSQENRQNQSEPAHNDSRLKPLKNVHRDYNELKATQSWVWNYCPRPVERRRKETFVNIMRSPYLSGYRKTPSSSHKLQSSQKCEAWLKSNNY